MTRSGPPDHLTAETTKHHLDWVDSARGFAVLGIIAVHVGQSVTGLPSGVARLADAGRYGVQVFLLISGLTIFLSLSKRTASEQGFWPTFYVRRFARIGIVAYAGMVVNVLVNHPPLTIGGVALTALFLNGWSPRWFNTLILGGWVLSVFWAFYAAVPLLVRHVRTARAAVALVLGSALAGSAATQLAAALKPEWGVPFFYMWPPAQLPVAALGVLLYFIIIDENGDARWITRGLAITGLICVGIVVSGHVPASGGAQFVYSPILACGLLVLAARPTRLLVNPLTQWLGRISYSMFIWHFFVVQGLHAIAGRPLSGIVEFAALYASTVAGSAAIGWLSYVTLERGSSRLGAHLAARYAPTHPRA